MNLKPRVKQDPEINLTSLIDVVFLLIIFFLVSSHLAKQESQLELPLPVADSGTITLDDYVLGDPVGSTFSGSFDVVMQEVTIAQDLTTTPVDGGCTGTLSASWSGTVEEFPAK